MKKTFLYAMMASIVMFASCKNNEVEEPDNNDGSSQEQPQQPSEDNQSQEENASKMLLAPVAFTGTFTEVSSAMLRTASQKKAMPALVADEPLYPQVDWTPKDGTWPVTLTVNYGENAVIGTDGLEHTGVMTIVATGRFEDEGSIITPNLDKFFVYGNVISGTQRVENMGKNNAGNLLYEVSVTEGELGTDAQFVYSEQTYREMVAGLEADGSLNLDPQTHRYSITGWMKGESKSDSIPSFDVTISENKPMLIAVGDLYPTEGLLDIHLTPAVQFDLSEQYAAMGLQNAPAAQVDDITLEFKGKNADGSYQMEAEMTVLVLTIEQTFIVSFAANADGIIENSIKVKVAEQV